MNKPFQSLTTDITEDVRVLHYPGRVVVGAYGEVFEFSPTCADALVGLLNLCAPTIREAGFLLGPSYCQPTDGTDYNYANYLEWEGEDPVCAIEVGCTKVQLPWHRRVLARRLAMSLDDYIEDQVNTARESAVDDYECPVCEKKDDEITELEDQIESMKDSIESARLEIESTCSDLEKLE